MDAASVALSNGLDPSKPRTYAALSEASKVPASSLWHRAHGRPSRDEKAKRQQYLTPSEEKALVKYILRMSHTFPFPVKYLRSLAFIVARERSCRLRDSRTNEAIKPPGKNWAQAFYKRHPELKSKRVKALDWNRHNINIFDKVNEWFNVIGKELHDPVILPENVFNMDETGVMLSMLGSVKVLVGKDDTRSYRGVGVKRTMVTAIECISADAIGPLILLLVGIMHVQSLDTQTPKSVWGQLVWKKVDYQQSSSEIVHMDCKLERSVRVGTLYKAIRYEWNYHRYLFSAGGSGCHYWNYCLLAKMKENREKFKVPENDPANIWAAFQYWYSRTGETRPNEVRQGEFQDYADWYNDWYGEGDEDEDEEEGRR